MPLTKRIISLQGIEWEKDHPDLFPFLKKGFISVGDYAMIENQRESAYNLRKNEYCVSFNYDFFREGIFNLEECKILFGKGFRW